MTRLPCQLALIGMLVTATSAAAAVSMAWVTLEDGGLCTVRRPLNPYQPSQFAIQLGAKGTVITVQNVVWQLPRANSNSMPVSLRFDRGEDIAATALVIAQVAALQLPPEWLPLPAPLFWQKLLSSRDLTITGPFKPGEVDIDLTGLAGVLPWLKDCAARQLPGQPPPFPP